MSLIKCPECGRDVSDTIKECNHCGYILKKEGKVIIHSYCETFAINPVVKVYKNNQYVAEIPKGETIELPVNEDTNFTFKSSMRETSVQVSGDTTTEIMLSFNRGTGALKAITNIGVDDVETNQANQIAYNQSIEKQKKNNTIWLIIGIICLIVGILMFI